jgi:hypothetical protein
MHGLCLSICLSLSVQLQAETASPSIRLAVLKSEWQEAWTTLRTMHAKIHRIQYDDLCHTVQASEGSLAFEVNGRCKLSLAPNRGHAAKVVHRGVELKPDDARPFTVLWTGDEVCMVCPEVRTYYRRKVDECRRTMLELQKSQDGEVDDIGFLTRTIVNGGDWMRGLRTAFMVPVARMASPADSVPILLSDPATIESAGFALTATKQHSRGLTAVPTTPATKRQCDRIDILFSENGLPYATNMIAPDQNRNVVHLLRQIRINDRSQLADFVFILDSRYTDGWPQ